MSNFGAAVGREEKKVMRTALIGVKPADVIMLKGYLRVLLRLEADLEWVPATHVSVDLYIINDEFRESTSVLKLLKDKPKNKVLYVRRSDNAEGLMTDNLVILPLQNLKDLSNWLYSNLPFLRQDLSQPVAKSAEDTTADTPKADHTAAVSTQTQDSQHFNTAADANIDEDNNGLLSVIEVIQARPEGLYELVCDQGKIALVNLQRQRIWLVGEGSVAPDKSWKLEQTTRAVAPDITKSIDLFQWLWQQAWNAPENLLPMVSDEQTYQLRYWPKPRMTNRRKELIHLLTALEPQPIIVRDLAMQVGTSVNAAKKVVAGLLLAGGLHPETYEYLQKHGIEPAKPSTDSDEVVVKKEDSTVSESKPVTTSKAKRSFLDEILARRAAGENSSASNASTATKATDTGSAKEEKLGFLAKLRRKLGL